MALTLSDQILAKVRGWLLEITDLTADQIVPADDSGPRPDLPYVTIQVLTSDILAAHAERSYEEDEVTGDLVESVRAHYTGSIQLDGYGRSAYDYIARAGRMLRSTQSVDYLRGEKITLRLTGGINDLSALVDDEIEARFQRDLFFGYTLVDSPSEHPIETETYEGEFDFSDHTFPVDVDLS